MPTLAITAALVAAAALVASPPIATAAPLFYADPSAFAAAAPGASAVDLTGLSQGLHANGTTVPGVSFSTLNPGSPSTALIVYGGLLGNNWFGDTLVLSFAPSITAIGLDVVSQIDEPGSAPISAPITEAAYSDATLLGSVITTEPSGFFGVTSATPITKLTLFSDCTEDCSTNISGLTLGAAASAGGTPVPEPSTAALVLPAIAGAGLLARRGRPKLSVRRGT